MISITGLTKLAEKSTWVRIGRERWRLVAGMTSLLSHWMFAGGSINTRAMKMDEDNG
jgi:hypothetical protein